MRGRSSVSQNHSQLDAGTNSLHRSHEQKVIRHRNQAPENYYPFDPRTPDRIMGIDSETSESCWAGAVRARFCAGLLTGIQ